MTIHAATDWYAQGFRIMPAHLVREGDDYVTSYVEQTIVNRCEYRNDLGNGYVDIDGTYWLEEFPLWVRKSGGG